MVNENIASIDIRLHVNYEQKDEASKLGARWDRKIKAWYAPKGSNLNDFSNYMFDNGRIIALKDSFINVPFDDKERAKSLGLFWNPDHKSWQILAGSDIQKIPSKYFQKEINIENNKMPFKEFAAEKGLIIDELVADGEIHRVAVEGGKSGAKDGAYIYHDDENGKVGWLQNFKTGETTTYGEGGGNSNKIKDTIKKDNEARNKERVKGYNEAAKKSQFLVADVFRRAVTHPYLEKKHVGSHNTKVDANGGLIVPLSNIDGKIRSFQRIDADGNKLYMKGGEKAGNFFQFAQPKDSVIICEGFATGASIYEATKIPVIAAMDTSNLINVALAVREKYGEKIIMTIAADNDHMGKENAGLKAAEKAAYISDATVVMPKFTEKEMSAKMTDFNDLASSRGASEVIKQIFEQNKNLSKPKEHEIEK